MKERGGEVRKKKGGKGVRVSRRSEWLNDVRTSDILAAVLVAVGDFAHFCFLFLLLFWS